MSHRRKHAEDLRGAARLAVAATRGVVGIVEEMHRVIGSGPGWLGRPLALPAELVTSLGYGAVSRVAAGVGFALDQSLAALAPVLGSSQQGLSREAAQAVLGGVLGDFLEETGNPLAIEMSLRRDGRALPLEAEALRERLPELRSDDERGGKLLVLVHGLCMNDLLWRRRNHDHGEVLARELGYTPIYLHYNSGLHVSQNGQRFAALLEKLVAAWPQPVEEIVLLAHSMGGLVARSACERGEADGHHWRQRLRSLICLGTPHHGAPLERGGSWVDVLLGVFAPSRPLARLGQLRSAGITDLRYGNVLERHWHGRDRFEFGSDERTPLPLPSRVRCYAVAARLARRPGARAIGDGLVPVDSALGRHPQPEHALAFPADQQRLVERAGHLDLLDHPEVTAALREWLAAP
jgi:pimeloyl-ACP methyl ester carboxylesterase